MAQLFHCDVMFQADMWRHLGSGQQTRSDICVQRRQQWTCVVHCRCSRGHHYCYHRYDSNSLWSAASVPCSVCLLW